MEFNRRVLVDDQLTKHYPLSKHVPPSLERAPAEASMFWPGAHWPGYEQPFTASLIRVSEAVLAKEKAVSVVS